MKYRIHNFTWQEQRMGMSTNVSALQYPPEFVFTRSIIGERLMRDTKRRKKYQDWYICV